MEFSKIDLHSHLTWRWCGSRKSYAVSQTREFKKQSPRVWRKLMNFIAALNTCPENVMKRSWNLDQKDSTSFPEPLSSENGKSLKKRLKWNFLMPKEPRGLIIWIPFLKAPMILWYLFSLTCKLSVHHGVVYGTSRSGRAAAQTIDWCTKLSSRRDMGLFMVCRPWVMWSSHMISPRLLRKQIYLMFTHSTNICWSNIDMNCGRWMISSNLTCEPDLHLFSRTIWASPQCFKDT